MRGEARKGVAWQEPAPAPESDTHLRQLTDALRQSLELSAGNPEVEAVHDTRTGTRRMEAALETALRNSTRQAGDEKDVLAKAVRAWERLLKKIRRAAAPVRDLDVQRRLLKKLGEELEGRADASTGTPGSGIARQVAKLEDALRDAREDRAAPLRKDAAKWAAKLDGHFEAFTAAMAQKPAPRRKKTDAAATALDAFARLASRMRQLDEENLHDFRKGAKKARYMAEAGGADERAGMVGKALKKLQDEIGDWHDWLMLAEEAHRFLDEDGARLTAEIERRRDVHFELAMKREGKMRGRLMGEWLASRTSRPATRASSASLKRSRVDAPAGRGTKM